MNTIYLVMYIIVPHFVDHGINIIMRDIHIKVGFGFTFAFCFCDARFVSLFFFSFFSFKL